MMDTTGKSNFWNLLFSLQLGYFVSLAIPRVGEFIKCFTSAETEKKPVSFVFGTVMAERIVDFIIFAFLLFLAFVFNSDFISDFWVSLKSNFPESSSSNKLLMIGGIVLVFVIIYPMINKMTDGEKNELQLMDGLKSVLNVPQKGAFWLSSLLIWICYFLSSYLLFFCFDSTSFLSFLDGYLTMIGGTVSRMLPINGGGIGAYHFVIENLLSSLGVEKLIGASYALLNHGIQFIFQIVVGIVAIVFLSKKVDLKNISKIKF
jgi:glycosyltransferase 2 family protein